MFSCMANNGAVSINPNMVNNDKNQVTSKNNKDKSGGSINAHNVTDSHEKNNTHNNNSNNKNNGGNPKTNAQNNSSINNV
jgi:hypothetical protein